MTTILLISIISSVLLMMNPIQGGALPPTIMRFYENHMGLKSQKELRVVKGGGGFSFDEKDRKWVAIIQGGTKKNPLYKIAETELDREIPASVSSGDYEDLSLNFTARLAEGI